MKTVAMTGATSGIGLETARLLAQRGFRVIGVGRSQESCARAKADILCSAPGAAVSFFAADLLKRREVVRLGALLSRDIAENGEGGLWALINNAGCARSW